ncbi:MAG: rod shape-determining protein RodA [Elusimicrobia bacterium]|nr:rod shape-determining protein RodA [Candidatus Liberimonas magnetica]
MPYKLELIGSEKQTLPKRFVEKMDWFLLIIITFIIVSGLIAVYSAVLHFGNPGRFFITQSFAIFFGFLAMILFLSFNYQYFKEIHVFIYIISILMLGLVLIFGLTIRGTRGWFHIGHFAFQPVEFTKIMFILVLAAHLDKHWREMKKLPALFVPLALLLGHIILVLVQPDFSSTLVYFPVTIALLYVAGAEILYLLAIILFGSIAVGIPLISTYLRMQPDFLHFHPFFNYLVLATHGGLKAFIVLSVIVLFLAVVWWLLNNFRIHIPSIVLISLSLIIVFGSLSSAVIQKSIKEYQRKRLVVFINPDIDPLGSGYNIIQSKIAIGSGHYFGKGFFSGTQTQLGFLPEQHTDFIFSVIGEETGFFFSFFLVSLYFALIWRALVIAREARDRYGSMVATGIATMFGFYAIINIGMVMGLMPAAGLPLPFVSYGGSSMVSSLTAIGILFSIHIRRYTN